MSRHLLATRSLLAAASVIFLLGALLHTRAYFTSAGRILDSAELQRFFASELKVLWLADSTTLLGLALMLSLLAANPRSASKSVILLTSCIPLGTTLLLYVFLGPFFAAHLLLAGTLMIVTAACICPPRMLSGGARGPTAS